MQATIAIRTTAEARRELEPLCGAFSNLVEAQWFDISYLNQQDALALAAKLSAEKNPVFGAWRASIENALTRPGFEPLVSLNMQGAEIL